MASIFSKIVSGEIPAHKVYEDEKFIAFLDVFPLVNGHTLVIPKMEIDYIFDMEDELLSSMIVFAKEVAIAIQKVVPCKKVGVSVIGLEVPHAHIHLIPMQNVGDMNFSKPKLIVSHDDLAKTAAQIRSVF